MESVEDIPAASILEGLALDWETYGEYLRAIDAHAQGRQRRRHGRPLRAAPLRRWASAGSTRRPRPTTTSRRSPTSSTRRWRRARSASRRRARCCTASPTAASCPARGRDERRAPRDRRRARPARQGCLRGRAALRAAGRRTTRAPRPRSTGWPRSTGAPAARSRSGRAEQRRTRALQGHPRPRRRGSRDRRRAPAADHGARHRPALRPAAPHVLRPHPVVAGAAGARPRSSGSRCSTTTRVAPS